MKRKFTAKSTTLIIDKKGKSSIELRKLNSGLTHKIYKDILKEIEYIKNSILKNLRGFSLEPKGIEKIIVHAFNVEDVIKPLTLKRWVVKKTKENGAVLQKSFPDIGDVSISITIVKPLRGKILTIKEQLDEIEKYRADPKYKVRNIKYDLNTIPYTMIFINSIKREE